MSNEYRKWEERNKLSPSSPEAYWAEKAWNAALQEINLKIVNSQMLENVHVDRQSIIRKINELHTGF